MVDWHLQRAGQRLDGIQHATALQARITDYGPLALVTNYRPQFTRPSPLAHATGPK